MKQLILFICIAIVIIIGGYYLTRTVQIDTNTPMQETKLIIVDTQEGAGNTVQKGNTVTVHYKGMLEDGTVFDQSYTRGTPFSFTVGAGQVIQGWEEGLLGMKVGGKRTLTIPSEMGYGTYGAGDVIPPNATLIFEIELLEIN